MTAQRPRKPAAALQADAIDARYGLEPVFEPGQAGAEDAGGTQGSQFQPIQCPYCGESFEILVDLSAGAASYIEDCQVCCQPIELSLEVDDAGALAALAARRAD
jgi:hypothetical protein